MQIFHCEDVGLVLPPKHRFPAAKYSRLLEQVEGLKHDDLRISAAPKVSQATLSHSHSPAYVERVFNGRLSAAEIRALGFPWSPNLVRRSRASVGATLAATHAALEEGVALSLAGGTHHAGFQRGAGFCVFNDVAVAAVESIRRTAARRVLIIDCDVHQGDGSAAMLESRTEIYTFSIHAARNYPHHKPTSDLDIGLPDRTNDEGYLDALDKGLNHAFNAAQPELVLYIAGADVYAGDRLGRLQLSQDGIARRDELVLGRCAEKPVPVAVMMGGGYADSVDDIVAIHLSTVLVATNHWRQRQRGS